MASNQIAPSVLEDIRKSMSRLMARAVLFNPCPLVSYTDIRTFWHRTCEPDAVTAWETLVSHNYEMYSCSTQNIDFRAGGGLWLVTLRMESAFDDQSGDPLLLKPKLAPADDIPAIVLSERLFEGTSCTMKEFTDWVDVCRQLHGEIADGLEVFEEVKSLVHTPGQLVRLIPEFIQYLPEHIRQRLGTRQSALPEGATTIDHRRVTGLANTLAKCYLMPKPEGRESREFSQAILDHSWVTTG